MTIALANRNMPDLGGWQDRHDAAMRAPRLGFERAFVQMLKGWHEYAETHQREYDSAIANDYVLGPEWAAMGHALLALLNGSLGRLDGGTLDTFIRTTMVEHGVEVDA